MAAAENGRAGSPAASGGSAPLKVLVLRYSQTGQTARALDVLLEGMRRRAPLSATVVDLAERGQSARQYPMPWSVLGFLRAQPECFMPGGDPAALAQLDVTAFDLVVIAYPVWFLCAAQPVMAALRSLGGGALAGKPVVTLSTCRNMWFEAQRSLLELIEDKGGTVVAHATVEDRGPTLATLITTPRFFLTGRRGFSHATLKKVLPDFGVPDSEFEALATWAESVGPEVAGSSRFHFNPSLALAEFIGKRISRTFYLPWPVVRRLPVALQNAYVLGVAGLTVACIFTLLPPCGLIGKLPPIQERVRRWRHEVVS